MDEPIETAVPARTFEPDSPESPVKESVPLRRSKSAVNRFRRKSVQESLNRFRSAARAAKITARLSGGGEGGGDAVADLIATVVSRREGGETAAALRAEGLSCKTLVEAGFGWKDLFVAGFPKKSLMQSGFNLTQLGAEHCAEIGITGHMLREAGYSDLLLTRAGFTQEQLALEERAATAQAKLAAARERVAALQKESEALETRRATVSDEERKQITQRLNQEAMLADQRRLAEIAAEMEEEEGMRVAQATERARSLKANAESSQQKKGLASVGKLVMRLLPSTSRSFRSLPLPGTGTSTVPRAKVAL